MGIVYRARDLRLSRSVAIKFLSSEVSTEEQPAPFQDEAQSRIIVEPPTDSVGLRSRNRRTVSSI